MNVYSVYSTCTVFCKSQTDGQNPGFIWNKCYHIGMIGLMGGDNNTRTSWNKSLLYVNIWIQTELFISNFNVTKQPLRNTVRIQCNTKTGIIILTECNTTGLLLELSSPQVEGKLVIHCVITDDCPGCDGLNAGVTSSQVHQEKEDSYMLIHKMYVQDTLYLSRNQHL